MDKHNRDDARQAFKDAGLTLNDLSLSSLQLLRNAINEKMRAGGYVRGTLRCKQRPFRKPSGTGIYAGIRCKSYYFDDREAVSFNPDGFVGFAGWADDENVQPILAGFMEWLNAQPAHAPD